jgi:oligopeptide/dipeptide ABC transporter ATP-binding protein
MLVIRDLAVNFQEKNKSFKRAVRGISLNINKSEVVAILGESGCGKSVTALSILNLINKPGRIVGGSIFYKNQDILKLNKKELRDLRGSKIAMVFQEPMTALNPSLTIGFQVAEPLKLHKKLKGKALYNAVLDVLASVKIPNAKNILKSFAYKLSGGLRQRVMIAMALACEPELLIADEPTTALDVTIQAGILKLLMEKKEEKNLSMLFISHDLGIVSNVADRVYVMYLGKIMESAYKHEIFNNPSHPYTEALIKSYPKKINKSKLGKLYSLEGMASDLSEVANKGCSFQERCSYRKALCLEREPQLFEVGKGHFSACFKTVGLI